MEYSQLKTTVSREAQSVSRISYELDFYKPTMSQLQYEKYPEAEVTFSFHNRGEQRLMDYIDTATLQTKLDDIRTNGWSQLEIDYLSGLRDDQGLPVFSREYLNFIKNHELPPIIVGVDASNNDLTIDTTGAWPLVTFWETVVMSEVNEMYFENLVQAQGLDVQEIYAEGDRRLSEKIAKIKEYPEIKFADFGTRRHFSLKWQRHVLRRLMRECSDNFIGTSNVGLALELGLTPIGTFAHELPMVYTGIAKARGHSIASAQNQVLEDWYGRYGDKFAIALTDTYTSDFFFNNLSPENAHRYRGFRHDSGDPIEYGERVIDFYEGQGIDPAAKTIVFSDSLDFDLIIRIYKRFKDSIDRPFGPGTNLTNDLGIPALNVVMKAVHVKLPTGEEADTVKLSDSRGKYTGPPEEIAEYLELIK